MPDTTPDYQRIVDDIRSKVRSGQLSPGEQLPTKRQMAADYRVSMTTVNSAVTVLRHLGFIRGHQGKALYVAEHPPT